MKMAMSGFTFTFLPTSSTVIGLALGPAGYNRIHVYVAYKYDSVYGPFDRKRALRVKFALFNNREKCEFGSKIANLGCRVISNHQSTRLLRVKYQGLLCIGKGRNRAKFAADYEKAKVSSNVLC